MVRERTSEHVSSVSLETLRLLKHARWTVDILSIVEGWRAKSGLIGIIGIPISACYNV
ncbi:MAG: hypothetical protein JSV20_06945 [Candidatus Bathyarchaeota archaeon]|nr:MAG: hypothetical protein JSV20_06945 [Candidatus Bathyarchaeota archaeon]